MNADTVEELRRSLHRKLLAGPLTAGELAESLALDVAEVGKCLRIMQRDGCTESFVSGALIKWKIA